MFTLPKPITLVAVQNFISDEVHITGKSTGKPTAVLSFVAVSEDSEMVPNAPALIVTLTGDAYNTFYASWNGEGALYETVKDLLATQIEGVSVSSATLTSASLTANVQEVMN